LCNGDKVEDFWRKALTYLAGDAIMVSQRAARPPTKRRFKMEKKMKKYEVLHERVEARYRTYRSIEEAYQNACDRSPESLGLFDSYEEAKALFDAKVKKCFSANFFTVANMLYINGDVYFIEEGEYEYDEDYERWECIDCPETLDFFASSLPEEEDEEEEEED
jgi:hypothetical protein